MTVTERVAYLKGLAAGLEIDPSSKEGKLFNAMIEALDDIAFEVSDLQEVVSELGEQVDMIDEDLDGLEEIVYDEDEEDEIQQVTDNEYIVLGSTSLDDIEERIGLPLEAEEYDSISGHVINLLEHFPNPGEHAEDDYAVYTVLESEKNRIDKIHLLVKPQPDEDDED